MAGESPGGRMVGVKVLEGRGEARVVEGVHQPPVSANDVRGGVGGLGKLAVYRNVLHTPGSQGSRSTKVVP